MKNGVGKRNLAFVVGINFWIVCHRFKAFTVAVWWMN